MRKSLKEKIIQIKSSKLVRRCKPIFFSHRDTDGRYVFMNTTRMMGLVLLFMALGVMSMNAILPEKVEASSSYHESYHSSSYSSKYSSTYSKSKQLCAKPGCNNPRAVGSAACPDHPGYGCLVNGCTRNVFKNNKCYEHYADTCIEIGCTNRDYYDRYCFDHHPYFSNSRYSYYSGTSSNYKSYDYYNSSKYNSAEDFADAYEDDFWDEDDPDGGYYDAMDYWEENH